MNFIRRRLQGAATGVEIAESPEGLDAFLQPGCAAAVWRRQMPAEVEAWLAVLDPDLLPRGRVIVQPSAMVNTVAELCDAYGMPTGPERDWLIADIEMLANRFANLMQTENLRLRLGVVTTNACRKFHIDAIKARLICTYRGTGTQYGIPNGDGDPTKVFTVQTGAPFLMRGTKWPSRPASGLVHRSPPIEGSGETRLVLVLDPADDPSEDE